MVKVLPYTILQISKRMNITDFFLLFVLYCNKFKLNTKI